MATKRACLACRARKVKCTPATPRCARCTELKIDECLYVPAKKRGAGNTLRMGEACQRCRKRKRRCDAKQPCTACLQLDGGTDCVYEHGRAAQRTREKIPADAQPFLFSFKCEPTPYDSSSWLAGEDPCPSAPDVISLETNSPVSPSACPMSPCVSQKESGCLEANVPDRPDLPTPQEKSGPETQLISFRGASPEQRQPATAPTFSFPSSLRFTSVPRPLHLSLSFVNPECFQISDATSSELDLSFRVAALRRLRLFGIHLTGPKQQAVVHADLSNTVVHPFFIHATAGLGMHFRANVSDTPDMVRLHAKHGQLAWEQVAEISKGNNALLKAQIYLLNATGALYGRWFDFCRQCLTKTCLALNAAKIQFLPATGHPPELTEDILENLATLSQSIYFENYMFLAIDGTEPKMTVRLEKEFRDELQRAYPRLFEICPLSMRTQAILLVKDVISIMSLCSAGGAKPSQLRQICDKVVPHMHQYTESLLQNMRQFAEIGDAHGAEIIQNSCVGCLAHLAVLCNFASLREPNSRPQLDAVCDWSLEQLGDLTKVMDFDEYTYLDLMLKISWERSLVIFDSRIDQLVGEERKSLEHHRGIVTEAWLDLKAKLPDESPKSITALLVFVDGRQEGSDYPNFMLASERRVYGI